MHFKNILFICAIVFLPCISYGQVWQRNYEVSGGNYTTFSVESYDQGYFISTMDWAATSDIKLYKTDRNGNILWERIIGKDKYLPENGGIVATDDGGLALTGAFYKTKSTMDNFLMKINACGELEWCKIYDLNQYSIGGDIKQLKNGDLVISSCVTINHDTINNYYNDWIFCTDPNGNLKWQVFNDEYVNSGIILDLDDNILIPGNVDLYDPYLNPDPNNLFIKGALYKTSPNGRQLWHSVYSVPKHINCQETAVVQMPDKGYLSFGDKRGLKNRINSALFLLKYDPNGNVKWTHLFGDTTIEEEAMEMARMNDSEYLAVAYSNYNHYGVGGHLELFKLNGKGDVLKKYVYPNVNPDDEKIWFRILPTSDHQFLLTGSVRYKNLEMYDSILVLKFNQDLEPDSFVYPDTNKYDYLCSQKPVFNEYINISTNDTVHITIPYPGNDTTSDTTHEGLPGSFLVYPNPVVSGLVHIRCQAGSTQAGLYMFDLLGREIKEYEFIPGQTGHADMNLADIAPGCYIMVLMQDGKRHVQKLIVE